MTRQQHYHHGNLRDTLVDLATKKIAEAGVDALSVRALAREAGVAHRAAYQHFPDKDALVAATLARAYNRVAERCEQSVNPTAPPEDRLRAAALAYSAFAFSEPKLFLAMTGPRINESGEFKDLEQALGKAWRHIAGPIGEAVDSGRFTLRDKRAAAAIFWGGLSGVLSQALLNRLKLKTSERTAFMTLVADRLIAGLRSRAP